MSEVRNRALNSAQISLLRLLDRSLSDQEVSEIQDLIGNYFDQKLKSSLSKDLENYQITEREFEALRDGLKPKDVVANRKSI